MKSRTQKTNDLQVLKQDFDGISTAYLVDFKGLTVGEDAELRELVAKARITYRVVKNTLARLAVEGTALEPVRDKFIGTTAIATTPDDLSADEWRRAVDTALPPGVDTAADRRNLEGSPARRPGRQRRRCWSASMCRWISASSAVPRREERYSRRFSIARSSWLSRSYVDARQMKALPPRDSIPRSWAGVASQFGPQDNSEVWIPPMLSLPAM